MRDQEIHRLLQDLVEIEYVIHDDQAVYVKFRTAHLNQSLLDYIESRVAPLGLQGTVSSLTTERDLRGSADVVVLRLHSRGHEYAGEARPSRVQKSSRWRFLAHPSVNVVLFVLTFAVVLVTGSAMIINRTFLDEWDWTMGFQFSVSLLGILTAHEFGHYFAARYHKLEVTLPYFLPGLLIPPWLLADFSVVAIPPSGTFGAFIRIKSPIRNKRQLLDVGAAGPLAGFVVCLVVLWYGFSTLPAREWAYQFYNRQQIFDGTPVIHFGSPYLFSLLGDWLAGDRMPAMYDIIHYPFLFAGWFGLLITALNLLPIGQLDGGHIMYAMLGRHQKYVAYVSFAVILFMGLFLDIRSWLVWAALIIILIRIKHPPVVDEDQPLDTRRMVAGLASMAILFLAFVPSPIYEAVVLR